MERDADSKSEKNETPELSFEDEVRRVLDSIAYDAETAKRFARQSRDKSKATFSMLLFFFGLWYVCEIIDTWKDDKK